jgi:hypothetical protein
MQFDTADFYVGLGADAEWLGTICAEGTEVHMLTAGLLGTSEDKGRYTEFTYRDLVRDIVTRGIELDQGYSPFVGDEWPWAYPDSGGTANVYAWKNGSIHVFEGSPQGAFLTAVHYPNGARKPSVFPTLGETK